MTATYDDAAILAHERHGSGAPVVFLHGLTFDRTTWRPVIERLGGHVCAIAPDLPGHGDSTSAPARGLEAVAAEVHRLLGSLAVERPILVGHSISAVIATIYASRYPVAGIVNVDQTLDARPFAELLQRLAPTLRGDGFGQAFAMFQQSMGLDLVPEPVRSQVLGVQDVRQEVVLAYWDEAMRTDAARLQARVEDGLAAISAPYLLVSGHELTASERAYLHEHLRDVEIEEWPGRGHFVHLAEADRFARRLRAFVERCTASPAHPAAVR